jgi:two-component system, cell cycle response regulator
MTNAEKQLVLEKIKSMPDLPSPSESAVKIIRLAENDSLSLSELESAVKADPAFAARLLRIANSGRKRLGGRPIIAIKDALATLGLPAVRGLALGFWLHSLALAQAFQTVSLSLKPAPRDEAFSVGLLANIGQLALACVIPEPYGKVLESNLLSPPCHLADKERAVLGLDRWELSAELMKGWGFPDIYTEPVAKHRQPYIDVEQMGTRPFNLACALALAADIADIIIYPALRTPEKMTELYRHGARISLEDEDLIEVGNAITQEWQEWVELLGLTNTPEMNFSWVAEAYSDAQLLTKSVTTVATGLTVLIVEDDKLIQAQLTTLLSNAGYQVITADNGSSALKICHTQMPDIIIADWLMPVMDGLELVRRVRERANVLQPYFLILTSRNEDENLIEAYGSGADDYLAKPIRATTLLARMKAGERILLLQREASRLYTAMRDVANELSASNRRLQTLATTDELTGFPNRRHAIERLQQEWSASSRHSSALSCLVLDIDAFKAINEMLGQEKGDAVLKEISKIIRTTMRTEDIVCRVGGDEFWILCPNTSADVAESCAVRLRSAIKALSFYDIANPISINIGTAERSPSMEDSIQMIEAAHRVLMTVKHAQQGKTSS